MKLRGHHLLCLYGFKGLGYSREFIDNLERILKILRSNSKELITLTDETDEICRACPYRKDNQCLNKKIKPEDFDRKVLSKIGLNPGTHLEAERAFKLIKVNIKRNDFLKWCSKCQWNILGYCAEGLETKNSP
jgi:uncharacterized protein